MTQELSFRQMPMIIAVTLFSFGITVNTYSEIQESTWLFPILVSLTFLMVLPKQFISWRIASVMIMISLFLLGGYHSASQRSRKVKNRLSELFLSSTYTYTGEIIEKSKSKKYVNLELNINGVVIEDKIIIISEQRSLLKIRHDENPNLFKNGDQIKFAVHLHTTEDEEGSVSSKYIEHLRRSGISYLGYIKRKDITLLKDKNIQAWKFIRYKLRFKALGIIDRTLDTHSKSIMKALLLGYKKDLQPSTRQQYANSGMIHILAVSGLHVGMIAYLLFLLIETIAPKWSRYNFFKIAIIVCSLISYAELSGGAPPVWRATLMTSMFLIARSISREVSSLNLIATAAFILLSIDHSTLFSLSFQMSFTAVIGIVLVFPILENIYLPKTKILIKLFSLFYLGISAQVLLIPVSIYYFDQVSLISPLTSIIAIPAAFVVLSLGIALLLFGWIHPILSSILSYTIEHSINLLTNFASTCSELDFSIYESSSLTLLGAALIMCATITAILAFYNRSLSLLKVSCVLLIFQGVIHTYNELKADYNFRVFPQIQDHLKTPIKSPNISNYYVINQPL